MRVLPEIFKNNRAWAESIKKANPQFFATLAKQQTPKYLWFGCSDSRVPANQLMGLLPGEVFVHRNIANRVHHTDLNALSVLQFAVDYLKVEHIIVCGHYLCGGVKASLDQNQYGLMDNWLRSIKDLYTENKATIDKIPNADQRVDKMCEINVLNSLQNICHTTIVQSAWRRNQPLSVHGWIYDIRDGLLRDLGACITSHDQVESIYQTVQANLAREGQAPLSQKK